MATMTSAQLELWIDTNITPAFVAPATSADVAAEIVAGLTAGETEAQIVARLAALTPPPSDPGTIVADVVVEWNAAPAAAVVTTPSRGQRAAAFASAPASRWSLWAIGIIAIVLGIIALVFALRSPTTDDINSALKVEHDATVVELGKKADDAKVAKSFDELSNVYLAKTDADKKFLAKADAESTYLAKDDANAKFAPLADIQRDYVTKRAASSYLSRYSAKKTYLSKADAATTYALKDSDGDTHEDATQPKAEPQQPQSDSDASPDTHQSVKLKVVIDGEEVKTFVGGTEE